MRFRIPVWLHTMLIAAVSGLAIGLGSSMGLVTGIVMGLLLGLMNLATTEMANRQGMSMRIMNRRITWWLKAILAGAFWGVGMWAYLGGTDAGAGPLAGFVVGGLPFGLIPGRHPFAMSLSYPGSRVRPCARSTN